MTIISSFFFQKHCASYRRLNDGRISGDDNVSYGSLGYSFYHQLMSSGDLTYKQVILQL
jgi:hypothetical protein